MMEGTLPFTNADRTRPRPASSDLETKNNNKKAKRNMKTIIKTILYLQMTALLLTAAFAGPASAGKSVPFKGSVQAVESYDIQFPTMFVDTSGSGNATHMGRFTVTWEFTVNLLNGAGIGSAHFIAANGDSLFTESLGQGDPTETPGINRVVEAHTITGGTGRFAGATGSFTLERLVGLATGVTAGSFDGTIAFGKAK
jgi:hypothetical protein